MKYDKETEAALYGSIVKWEKIVAGNGEDNGVDNCPLCQRFVVNADGDFSGCEGCPVRNATGSSGCEGSPYDEWAYYMDKVRAKMPNKVFDDESRRLAQVELDFLRSLK